MIEMKCDLCGMSDGDGAKIVGIAEVKNDYIALMPGDGIGYGNPTDCVRHICRGCLEKLTIRELGVPEKDEPEAAR